MATHRVYCAMACLAIASRARAEDAPASLAEAQEFLEANLRTAEGKAYEEKLGGEFVAKHLQTLKNCKQDAGREESFWFLLKLDKYGAVREVLLHPVTTLGNRATVRARQPLLRSTAASMVGRRVSEACRLRRQDLSNFTPVLGIECTR